MNIEQNIQRNKRTPFSVTTTNTEMEKHKRTQTPLNTHTTNQATNKHDYPIPKSSLSSIWIGITIALAFVGLTSGNHDAKRLYDDLMRKNKYNKLIRPVGNSSHKLTVKLGLKLAQLIDVDERNQIISLNVWMLHEWEDFSLRWDPTEYGGVDILYVPSESLWLPDIVLYNNGDGDYTVTLMTKATLKAEGTVEWNPPVIFKSHCDIDVEYFPFDEQKCKLKFGSWSYDGLQVDLRHIWNYDGPDEAIIDHAIDLKNYYRSSEWDLMTVPAKKNIIQYPCCVEPYPDITFNFTIRRRPLFYTINLVIPCVSINLLTVLGFYMPSDSGEKISLSISILLSLSLFQLLLLELIPPTSLKTPLIGKYILFTNVLVCLSVFSSVMILNINFRSHSTHRMPRWIRALFMKILPRILLMGSPKYVEGYEEEELNLMDFSGGRTELSNYENPFKKKFTPLMGALSTEDLSTLRTGLDPANMSKFCAQCAKRRLHSKYPPNALRALDGTQFIAKHLKEDQVANKVKQDWRYAALVFDRLLLWIFTAGCLVGITAIVMKAPSLYDNTLPLETSEGIAKEMESRLGCVTEIKSD